MLSLAVCVISAKVEAQMEGNQFLACGDEVDMIGNLTRPLGEVIVFQGWQGLHGKGIQREWGWRLEREGMSK
ncbi:hypothetical protein EYF80_015930 [Liparis tanakae]|uniref:Uncharacterized protein n=1 Tax=Liparis tanakae TaxID=230148 RepID=A0A4Z2I9W4_9TELE|nr:hypothetical protein EYF80_015930 [Liparis tanakae]